MQKKTKAQKASIDLRCLGDEPQPFDVTDPRDSRLIAALRWYGYFYKVEDAKKWLLDYVKKNCSKETYNAIKAAPTWRTSMTAGTLAHLQSRGCTLTAENIQFLNDRIQENARKRADDAELNEEGLPVEANEPVKINPHVRLQRKIAGQMADIEGMVDDHLNGGKEFEFYTWAVAEQASPQLISKVKDFYERNLYDMDAHPEDYKGAFHKKERQLYLTIVGDCDRLSHNKKVVRKPRKLAAPSTEKQVKGLKFKAKDHDLKAISIAPTEIIGAKELWVFSTKYNELGVFRASNDMGLHVKGASIIDFDEKSSVVKKARKPEETLAQVAAARKPETVMKGLNTSEKPISARIREDQILLKVVK